MLFLRYFVLFAQNCTTNPQIICSYMPEALTFVIIYSCKWPHKYFLNNLCLYFPSNLALIWSSKPLNFLFRFSLFHQKCAENTIILRRRSVACIVHALRVFASVQLQSCYALVTDDLVNAHCRKMFVCRSRQTISCGNTLKMTVTLQSCDIDIQKNDKAKLMAFESLRELLLQKDANSKRLYLEISIISIAKG